jgi:hypothetical protein
LGKMFQREKKENESIRGEGGNKAR